MRVLFLAVLAACGSPKSPPADAPSEGLTPSVQPSGTREPTPEAPSGERPAGTDGLEELLRAWHAEDLPGPEVLDAHEDAEASLIWLGSHGEPMVMRVRALTLLKHRGTPTARAALMAVAQNRTLHAAVQAGALAGLGGQDLANDAEARALVEAGLSDRDLRVQMAAIGALTGVQASRPLLEAVAADEGANATVRQAASDALR